jgi:hypothetical protein
MGKDIYLHLIHHQNHLLFADAKSSTPHTLTMPIVTTDVKLIS